MPLVLSGLPQPGSRKSSISSFTVNRLVRRVWHCGRLAGAPFGVEGQSILAVFYLAGMIARLMGVYRANESGSGESPGEKVRATL